jgi:hypothetical protein
MASGASALIAAASIACDDLDLRLIGKPTLCRYRLAIRQQRDCLAPFEIADDRPIALITPPCPVVDPNHGRNGRRSAGGGAPKVG